MGTVTIGVTGATGQVGGRVARLLDEAGATMRLLVRAPASERLPRLARPAEAARVDYADRALCTDALRGVDVLLMVSASESATTCMGLASTPAHASDAPYVSPAVKRLMPIWPKSSLWNEHSTSPESTMPK